MGDDEEWRFELEDLEDDGEAEDEGSLADALDFEEELEPGSPTLEHVVFVLLGALVAILVVGRMFGLL